MSNDELLSLVEGQDLLQLDEQLCFLLYSASRAITKGYRPLLEPLGLTYPQYLVMLVLWEWDQVDNVGGVKELGQRLRLDSGTLTPLLKRLQQAGLVDRNRSRDDEREIVVGLTDVGRALKKQAEPVPRSLLCQFNDRDIDPLEILALREKLREFVAQI